jgi:hypothetical protein
MAFSINVDHTINALVLTDSEDELFTFYDINSIIFIDVNTTDETIEFSIKIKYSDRDDITFLPDRDNVSVA